MTYHVQRPLPRRCRATATVGCLRGADRGRVSRRLIEHAGTVSLCRGALHIEREEGTRAQGISGGWPTSHLSCRLAQRLGCDSWAAT
jgi:hypothetical protein